MDTSSQSTPRIFVSHSHKNNAFCAEMVRALRGAGADVWYDDENLQVGQLGPTIERELRERPVFIVVLSPASLASRWVEDETRWAYSRLRRDPTRIILPVTAEAIPDADDIWLFLQDFKRIEAPGVKPYPLAEAISRTLHALQLTLPGEAPLPTHPQSEDSMEDLIAKGKALAAQGKYVQAIPFFESAAQLDPNSDFIWFSIGCAYGELRQWSESLAAFERALELNETIAETWANKARVLNELRRYGEALTAADHAVALKPDLPEALHQRAVALGGLRRPLKAVVTELRAQGLERQVARTA